MEVVGLGAKLGLEECQHQFATSKWNCSHIDQRKKGLLGLLTSKGTNMHKQLFRIKINKKKKQMYIIQIKTNI